jgi:hypothetical protein
MTKLPTSKKVKRNELPDITKEGEIAYGWILETQGLSN